MRANRRRWHIAGTLLMLPVSAAWADQAGSKLSGAWVLVRGSTEFVGEQQPLPDSDQGRTYVVIRPDGSFYKAGEAFNFAFDSLRDKGDRLDLARGGYLEVANSHYGPESSKVVLDYHEGSNEPAYRISFEISLSPDGAALYRAARPSYGGAELTVSATLRRVEGERPWQPEGLIREWRLSGTHSVSVDLSSDGRYVIAAGVADRVVHVWDVQSGNEVQRFTGHTNDVCAVTLSADGKLAASGSRAKGCQGGNEDSVRVWTVETGKELYRFEPFSEVARLRFLPDADALFVAGSGSGGLAFGIWDLNSGSLRASAVAQYGAQAAVLSPDGRRIVVRFWGDETGCPLKLFDATTGVEGLCFAKGQGAINGFIVSPDGRRALIATQDGYVQEWSLETGDMIRRLRVDSAWASSVAYLPDGKTILTANESDDSIHLWDFESGTELLRFAGHRDHIRDLRVSSDGKTAVSCSTDGTVRAWRIPCKIGEGR